METIKVLPIIFIPLLLSGCILSYTESTEIVVIPAYDEDAIIDYVEFHLPLDYHVKEVTNISLSLIRPDETSPGDYSQSFYNGERTCRVSIPRTQLYYPGTWTVEFNIDDMLVGNKHFWVEDKEHDRDHYVVENYRKTGSTVYFNVYNDGKEAGWVEIVVFATNRLTLGGKHVYDRTYIMDEEYLRPGHRQSYDTIISETDYVTIMLNGEEYEFTR
jgi:hypothetical protein